MQQADTYLHDLIAGFQNKDARYVDLGNHSGKPETHILKEIPFDELGNLAEVKALLLKNNQIRDLSSRFGELTSLEVLDISDNPLGHLPESFGQLRKLKSFRASNMFEVDVEDYLSSLMAGPGHYPRFLSHGGLTDLPESFANLQELQSLMLDGNRLSNIPDSLCACVNLTSLDLSGNLLTSISPRIGQLQQLRYLQLSRNNFQELPDEIGNLINLERLRLDHLDGIALPEGIGGLRNLKMLEICHGRIRHIPVEVKTLDQLADIYVINSEISETDLNVFKVFLPAARIHFEMEM